MGSWGVERLIGRRNNTMGSLVLRALNRLEAWIGGWRGGKNWGGGEVGD